MSALIFDRTQADTDRAAYLIGKIQRREMLTEAEQAEYNAGLRGCYNITDLNRVEAKVRELAETLRSYGYSVDYTVPMKGASVLPSGYTELEYIQSSGTQYINTNFKPDGETTVNIVFQTSSAPDNLNDTLPVYGAATDYNSNAFEFWTLSGGFATYGSQDYKSNLGITTGKKHTVRQAKNVLTVDGTSYTFTKQNFTAPYSLLLFATHRSSGIKICASAANLKIYSCEIYNNGTLVRNFVPVKNSSGTIGLYDLVNSAFYTNAGSGTFTAGADIVGFTASAEVGKAEDRDWQYTDTMLESDVLLYLENIAALRNVIKLPPDVPPIPTIDRWIDWMAANDIERIVYELDRMIYGIVPLFRRCGTFRAGKNAQHLLLAKGVN